MNATRVILAMVLLSLGCTSDQFTGLDAASDGAGSGDVGVSEDGSGGGDGAASDATSDARGSATADAGDGAVIERCVLGAGAVVPPGVRLEDERVSGLRS